MPLAALAAIRIALTPAASPAPCTGSIVAETSSRTVRAPITSAGEQVIAPGPGTWRVSLASPNCWSEPREVSDGTALQMPYWRTASVHGAVRFDGGEAVDALCVQFESTNGSPRGEVACTIERAKWSCNVPDTTLDLKLSATSFAPVYRWSVHPPRQLDVVFEHGASLTGKALREDGTPAAGGTVEVKAAQYAAHASEIVPQRGWRATVDERGFFQVRGLTPGQYQLTVRVPDRTPAVARDLRLGTDELALRDPLVLQSLAHIDVIVTPPVDANDRPWIVRLGRREGAGLLVPAGEVASEPSGHASFANIERGEYRVDVVDSRASTVLRTTVTVDSDAMAVPLQLTGIAVEGRMRMGDRPLAAELKFSSDTASIAMRSDGEGHFTGSLPHAGAWNVGVRLGDEQTLTTNVDVKAVDGRAKVDVSVPETHIGGRVVDDQNHPIAEAQVLVLRRADLMATAITRPDGTFGVAGVAEGSVRLQARHAAGDSAVVAHDAGSDDEVTLIIESRTSRTRRLLDSTGAAVAGALVRYTSPQGRAMETATGPNGELTLELPRSVDRIDAAILAAGYPLTLATIDLTVDAPVSIDRVTGRLSISIGSAPPWPTVIRGTARFVLPRLFRPRSRPGPPDEVVDDAFALDVAPGPYAVCMTAADCRTVTVVAGANVRVSFATPSEETKP